MKKDWKRLGALLLTLVMVLSMVPVTALAAEGDTPEYTLENINAGLFDVGANPTKSGDTWSANYSNPAEGSDTSKNGTVIKATAPSYQTETSGDGIPYLAVDGTSTGGDKWHTSYNSNADKEYLFNHPEDRYIQLEIVGGSVNLAALRYIGNDSNGAIKSYRVLVTTDTTINDNTQWTTVASGTWPGNGNWQFARFKETCSAKFVRLYADTAKETETGHYYINAKEIRLVKAVEGKELPPPTETKYLRHTGSIEEGTYVIYDNGRNLHNQTASPKRTDQCGTPSPEGDTIGLGDCGAGHLWRIARNDAGGYTIQGDKSGDENYLTTSPTNTTQLALSSDSTAAVKLSIEEATSGGYKLFYDNNGTTMYFGLRSGQNGWEFSDTEHAVQLFKETLFEYPKKTISGKVTDSEGAGLAGATVTLATGTNYAAVADVTATTDSEGNYSISVFGLTDGTYYVRASKDGYSAKINTTPVGVKESMAEDVPLDVQLTAVDTASAKFAYTMEANVEGQSATRPTLGFAASGTLPTNSYEGDNPALKLSFTGSNRMNNLVRLVGTGVGNGVVEFDATRTQGSARFGLAFRFANAGNWIYIGQVNGSTDWCYNHFNNPSATTKGPELWSADTTGPSFGPGDTRHFRVEIQDETADGSTKTYVTFSIDGITIFDHVDMSTTTAAGQAGNTNNLAPVSAAADVGFVCGLDTGTGIPSTVFIDNLYIFRDDPTYTVTLGSGLAAQINTSAGDEALVNNQAAAKDTIKITATDLAADQALDAVTVTGADDATVATQFHAAEGDNPAYFTFEMPESAVTVSGTFRPKVTGVSISGTNKEGKTLTATVEPAGAAGHVTYQWYHQANANQSADVDATAAGWTACTDATSATKTVGSDDLNRKVKVVVTGDGTTYARTVAVNAVTSEVMAAKDIAVTGVSFTRSSLTMWSNLTEDPDSSNNSVLPNTATLTANVAPPNANPAPTYAWSVVHEDGSAWADQDIITLATDATETNTKQITANKAGKVWVKVTVTGGEKSDGTTSTASATIPVTVKTGITSITLTKGSDTLTSDSVLTIYANDGDADKTVTVNAAVNTGASAADLVWSCGHDGEDHIFQLGGADDAGSAAGGSVVISAYDSHTLVGEETVTVSAPTATGNTADPVTFTVKVVHKLDASEHSVSISGTPKLGNELSVNLTNVPSTVSSDKLNYQWKRNGSDISGATNETYTPTTADDVGATITVTVTAKTDSYYEGSLTSDATTAVQKLDAPATPTLSPNKPTTQGGSDGSITINNYNSGYTYQIKSGDGSWGDATVTSEGKIENLEPGAYSVKVKETDTRKESAAAPVKINDADAVEYTITSTDPTEGATISVTDKATKGTEVTITLTVTEGWQVDAVKVNDSSDGVTAGENNTWTFTMPEGNVTVTAEVSKKQVKITHSLSEGLSCSLTEHDEDGNHVVDYGTVTSITLNAAEGYNLPTSIKVTYTDGTEAPTERCSYNSSTGEISFPQGIQRNITITATAPAKTYTATFEPAGTTGNLTRAFTSTTPIAYNGTLTATLTPASGYSAPAKANVEVTVGGAAAEFDYAVNETTGVATVTVNNVKGNVVIKANSAVKNTTAVTDVTIGIGHSDTTVTSDVPHVGDLLTATVTPTGADVDVQWYAGESEISGATELTYTILAADLGKTIKVKVTGTGDYSGEVTSDPTEAVENYVKQPTDITLDQTTASLEFGKTLTLTATVEPEDATDKTVTWTSSNEAAATVAGGVVTAVGVGSTTITAKNSANQTATCAVTVTAAQVGVTLSGKAKVGEILTATVTPTGATARIYWFRVGAGQNGEDEPIENTERTYTLVADDAGYKIMVSVEATGANYDGTASATTAKEVVGENEELPTNAITISDSENGTVTADKEEASEGETVTLTVTPAEGYKLDTLTVTGESGEVEVTDNTFVMPDEAVTVTATFVEDGEEPPVTVDPTGVSLNKTTASVQVGKSTTLTATVEPEGATGELSWSSDDEGIATVDENGEVTGVAEGTTTITVTVDGTEFAATCEVTVTKATSGGSVGKQPSASTSTNNPDGSTTTTVTNPDGSKTSTTEKPDGTKETVETKKDGTKTETTEKPDGTKEVVETKPDGTVTETVETPDGTKEVVETLPDGTKTETTEKPDGAKEIVETLPDGTKTETAIDPEGAMTEKVTDPEENVTITVTDAEGEELAKVELPATIPAPETKFEDVPEAHWAEDAINTVAGLGLVKGVDGNRYDMTTAMDRGSLATILYRLSNGKSGYKASFTDVAEDKYYSEGVAWAAKVGVVTGFSKDIFAPEQIITREQLAVMLARYAKLIGMDTKAETSSLNTFTDGDKTGAWAADSVSWCIETGILRGKGGNVLDPKADVSRAEVAVMLERFIALIK